LLARDINHRLAGTVSPWEMNGIVVSKHVVRVDASRRLQLGLFRQVRTLREGKLFSRNYEVTVGARPMIE